MDNRSYELVDITETAGTITYFNNVVKMMNSVLNVNNDKIPNRDERSLRKPITVGKNDISIGKNNININTQVPAMASYASIVKQSNKLTS